MSSWQSSATRPRCGSSSTHPAAIPDRSVKFALPPIESAADIAAAMKAVTSALADGVITPGEAGTIAAVVDTFVRAIETSDFDQR